MTDLTDGILEENMVLSNRDKSRHGDERGLDGKRIQTEPYQDHAANREIEPGASGDGTDRADPDTTGAGAQGSLDRRDEG